MTLDELTVLLEEVELYIYDGYAVDMANKLQFGSMAEFIATKNTISSVILGRQKIYDMLQPTAILTLAMSHKFPNHEVKSKLLLSELDEMESLRKLTMMKSVIDIVT